MSKKGNDTGGYSSYTLESFKAYDFESKDRLVNQIMRYMLDKTINMFEYKGLPDSIPKRSLELYLQTKGHSCITKVDGVLYPLFGGLGGSPDPYYLPTLFTGADPALPKLKNNLVIDKDCVIIANDFMYMGLTPMMQLAATRLADNIISMRLVDINSRVMSLVSAADTNVRDAYTKYIKDLIAGKIGVAADNAFITGLKTQPYATTGASHMLVDLIEEQQYIKASFLNDIGINANFNMKREALNSAESSLNDDVLRIFVDGMLQCRREGLEKVNAMYGTNITVDFGSAWKLQEIDDAKQETEDEEKEVRKNEESDLE